jgi:hypothetical protein
MNLNQIKTTTTWSEAASSINNNNQKIEVELEKLQNATIRNKGFYLTYEQLVSAHPTANVGDVAYVLSSDNTYISYRWDGEFWELIGEEYVPEIPLENYLPKTGGTITGDLEVEGDANFETIYVGEKKEEVIMANGELKPISKFVFASEYDEIEYNDVFQNIS